MRNPVLLMLALAVALVRPAAAQPAPRPVVPSTFDVAGLHLVLNAEAQQLVQQKADGLCRHQPSFQARVDLADAAFPIIDRVLREEGVPVDFRYLALQESALVGDAQSPHQAVGYWQLKRETATGLGLLVNEDVDERMHLAASTRAAARYLARNNAGLHNWLNALLSYNTGLSGVQPYTLPTDADATEMAITEATSPYVLMFLAHKLAFEPACGQNPAPALRLREFAAVAGQSLSTQALALHVDSANLAVHNRWLLAPVVPAGRPYTLIVPVGDVTQAAGIVANQRLQSRPELLALPTVAANAAEVRLNDLRALIALPGETPADLARRGNQRLGEFLHHNELTAFDAAVPGRPYYLERKRDVGAVEYHVLQPSETIFDVAQKYGIRQKAILAKNRMSRRDELRPGRLLWLQHVRPREVAVEYRTLPEGVALERAATGSLGNDALVEQLNEPAVASRSESGERVKIKIKVKRGGVESTRVLTEDRDGWGDVLSTAKATAEQAPAGPVPAPAAPPAPLPAAKPAQLPPLAATPGSETPADEPRPTEPIAAASVPERPATVTQPAAEPAAMPAPAAARPLPAAPNPEPVAATATASGPAAVPATHRVEPHESVYSVSRRFNIAPATLMALNHLTPASGLVIGQVLVLREQGLAPAAATLAPIAARSAGQRNPALYASGQAVAPVSEHTVAKGETLYSIARLYKVAITDLQAWNAKLDTNVRVGEVLRVQASAK